MFASSDSPPKGIVCESERSRKHVECIPLLVKTFAKLTFIYLNQLLFASTFTSLHSSALDSRCSSLSRVRRFYGCECVHFSV